MILGDQFSLSKQDIFFGYKYLLNHPYNFLIFHMKYYIFQAKLQEKAPVVNDFLNEFKIALKVEKSLTDNSKLNYIPCQRYANAFAQCTYLFR